MKDHFHCECGQPKMSHEALCDGCAGRDVAWHNRCDGPTECERIEMCGPDLVRNEELGL